MIFKEKFIYKTTSLIFFFELPKILNFKLFLSILSKKNSVLFWFWVFALILKSLSKLSNCSLLSYLLLSNDLLITDSIKNVHPIYFRSIFYSISVFFLFFCLKIFNGFKGNIFYTEYQILFLKINALQMIKILFLIFFVGFELLLNKLLISHVLSKLIIFI